MRWTEVPERPRRSVTTSRRLRPDVDVRGSQDGVLKGEPDEVTRSGRRHRGGARRRGGVRSCSSTRTGVKQEAAHGRDPVRRHRGDARHPREHEPRPADRAGAFTAAQVPTDAVVDGAITEPAASCEGLTTTAPILANEQIPASRLDSGQAPAGGTPRHLQGPRGRHDRAGHRARRRRATSARRQHHRVRHVLSRHADPQGRPQAAALVGADQKLIDRRRAARAGREQPRHQLDGRSR